MSINDSGLIVGLMSAPSYEYGGYTEKDHAVLLVPITNVPEGESWAMVMGGGVMLMAVLRRRKAARAA